MSKTAVIEVPAESFSRKEERALAVVQPDAATPMAMLALAVHKGMDPATINQLLDLQERYEKVEASKAFNAAFASFKAEAVKIIKNRTVDAGPLNGKKYAELFSVVNAVTPALSRNGLSAAWKITKDDKDWIEVTCTIKHVLGHSDSVSMGGPPDTGGAKSPIQARASTVSYLERYTLKAICGVSEQGDDTDGAGNKGMDEGTLADHLAAIDSADRLKELQNVFTFAYKAAQAANDKSAMAQLMKAKDSRKNELKGKE